MQDGLQGRFDRRTLLRRTAGAGLGLAAFPTILAACGGDDDGGGEAGGGGGGGGKDKVTWISPRGRLEVMDDYNLWVPIEMGYFDDLNLEVELLGGPQDATAVTKFVAENQADVGYPSPGILTSSIDSGVPVYSVFEMIGGQVFDFAIQKGSDISSVQDLEGKKISLWAIGGQVVADPILVEAGVDPKSVTYVEGGAGWGQIVSQGQADAALAWEGLRAQWVAEGLELDFLIGKEFSSHPSNSYAIRKSDLEDDAKRDVIERFLQGAVMGFEFARANPQAATQITYRQFPSLEESMTPQLALESMAQLASLYAVSEQAGNGWGHHPEDGWQNYLDAIFELGQIKSELKVEDVLTNELIEPVNSAADVERARSDAESYEVDEDFQGTTVPSDLEL